MKIKNIVLISLIVSLSLMLLILVLGSMLPTSTLDNMSSWLNKTESSLADNNNTTDNPNSNTVDPAATVTPTPTPTTKPSVTQTPAATAAPTSTPAYCSGKTPCYGRSSLASHATTGSCWSYQTAGGTSVIYNMTTFNTAHSDGPKSQILAGCGTAINWGGVPSNGKHTAAKSNTQATFTQYKVGYYDASKA